MLSRHQIIQWKQQWLLDHFSWRCFVAVKLFITTGFLKSTTYFQKAEEFLGRENSQHFAMPSLVSSRNDAWEPKNLFHFTCPSDKNFAHFGCPNTKSTPPKKKKALPKQISCGWLRCHDKNHWIMNWQYPEKGCYSSHKQRDVFCKLHKTFNSWPRQIQHRKILHSMLA